MSKLQIRVTLLVLAATLAAFGVASVAPAAAADVGTEGKWGMERRVRDADFLRHNYSANPQAVKADVGTEVESGMELKVRDADFLRHNYATNPRATKVKSGMERRVHDADFLRHNYGTPSLGAEADEEGPPQTQGDPEPIGYRQNKR